MDVAIPREEAGRMAPTERGRSIRPRMNRISSLNRRATFLRIVSPIGRSSQQFAPHETRYSAELRQMKPFRKAAR